MRKLNLLGRRLGGRLGSPRVVLRETITYSMDHWSKVSILDGHWNVSWDFQGEIESALARFHVFHNEFYFPGREVTT